MSLALPNIFNRENHTLENFYRYSFLFFSFLYLFIAISIYTVYLPTNYLFENTLLSTSAMRSMLWINLLLFLDSFATSVLYKRHKMYGIWRYRNAMIGFYLIALLMMCTVFVLNYIF